MYFYLTDDWKSSESNRLCLNSLRHYQHNFDDIVIYAGRDKNCSKRKERMFIKWVDGNITARHRVNVIDNDPKACECSVFYPILADIGGCSEIYGDNDIVFLCHSKGYTNMTDPKYPDKDAIKHWIGGMWWFNNRDMAEIEDAFSDKRIISVGMFMVRYWNGFNRHNWHYSGTMFWYHPKRLREYIRKNRVVIPKLSNRWWTEKFLGNIYPIDHADTTCILYDEKRNRFDGYGIDKGNPQWQTYLPRHVVRKYSEWYDEIKDKKL